MKSSIIFGFITAFLLAFLSCSDPESDTENPGYGNEPITFVTSFSDSLGCIRGYSGKQTRDGGYIAIAYVGCGSAAMLLVKTDKLGRLEWKKNFQGPFQLISSAVGGWCVQESTDGGYILLGKGFNTSYLIKTDRTGAVIMQKNVAPTGAFVLEAPDGGFILLRNGQRGEMFLEKLHPFGTVEWTQTYATGKNAVGKMIQPTRDGGYILLASIDILMETASRMYLIKVDSGGKVEWETILGNDQMPVIGTSVKETSDRGFVALGSNYLFRLNHSGQMVWHKYFSEWPFLTGIQETTEGGFILLCKSGPQILKRTDAYGEILWEKPIAIEYQHFLNPTYEDIQLTADGGYILSGTLYIREGVSKAGDHLLLLKADKNGYCSGKLVRQ